MLLSYLGSCLENSEVSHLVIIPNKFIYDLFSLKDKFMHINSPLSEMTGTNQCHTIINELSIVFKGEMGKILCHQEPDWRAEAPKDEWPLNLTSEGHSVMCHSVVGLNFQKLSLSAIFG